MQKISMDTVRFGETKTEPKTRFQQSNEDRMNMNFKRLLEAIEELQAEVEKLQQ